jgi:caa(3)-type oxidase subunit IV
MATSPTPAAERENYLNTEYGIRSWLLTTDHKRIALLYLLLITVVALTIATCKALLVVLFFMGVKYISQKMTIVVIVAGIFWLAILMVLSMADYGTRLWS